MVDLISEKFGDFFQKKLILEIGSKAQLKAFPKGQVLIDVNKCVKSIPLVISVTLKIVG